MQQLSEGNIEWRPPIKHRRKKKPKKAENKEKSSVSKIKKANTLSKYLEKPQKKILDYA